MHKKNCEQIKGESLRHPHATPLSGRGVSNSESSGKCRSESVGRRAKGQLFTNTNDPRLASAPGWYKISLTPGNDLRINKSVRPLTQCHWWSSFNIFQSKQSHYCNTPQKK